MCKVNASIFLYTYYFFFNLLKSTESTEIAERGSLIALESSIFDLTIEILVVLSTLLIFRITNVHHF